jgi:thiol-disulfide isomerase/thioredoxin
MMIKKLFFLLLFPVIAFSQQAMKGHFNPAEGYTFAILYRIAPDNVFYVADSNIAADGTFKITLPKDLKPGMHRIVYNVPQDQYFFDFIYNGKEDIEFNFSNKEGAIFLVSDENKLWTNYRKESGMFEKELTTQFTETSFNKKEVRKLLKEKKGWLDSVQKQAKGTTAYTFINVTKPYFPSKFEDIQDYKIAAKKDLLEVMDVSNPLLQNSAILLEQSLKYIFNHSDPENKIASRKEHIDLLVEKLQSTTPQYQKNLLKNVYDFMMVNEQLELSNYLAEKHLIAISESANDPYLAAALRLTKSLSLGKVAPDFSWPAFKEITKKPGSLLTLDGAENYIVFFWSSLCSHCLEEVPILHEYMAALPENKFKVIAVGLEDFEQEWTPKAAQFSGFTNVLGLGKWNNEIGNKYDVTETPSYYLLDKDKKIVAKPETLEDLILLVEARDE